MASPGEERSRVAKPRSDYGSKLVILIFIVVFSAIIITAASLETQSACFCYTHVDLLEISKVTFGSMPGQVSFWHRNYDTKMNITVARVFQGTYGNQNAAAMINSVISPASNLTLTITFSNIIFKNGTVYNFGLVTSNGNIILTTATP